ncbi:hypothetical protein RN001_004165 [Aquatica leii]|uniref:Glucose-methanol-choline oxidoreductase N-terminal domain-containing protein n=1 Tax=Aquatica leii TaxID=1421715 RepID=A0AAN7SMN8_9COLE|nr:hypothetical protein RN001_004165 [Aquatica leii]
MKMASIAIICIIFFCVHYASGAEQYTVDDYLKIISEELKKSSSSIGLQNAYSHKPLNNQVKDFGAFSYIVIGGGSAGAVIASRLSENPKKLVLLLEAGGKETTFGNIPGLSVILQTQEYNWNYNTTPQTTSCLAMENQECAYPRGKGLGGSSLINALAYARGNREDYDNWENMGNTGWSYNDCLDYFKKAEHFNIPGDLEYHGRTGPLNVEHHKPDSPQLTAFLEANRHLGYEILDYNGESQIGASKTQFNYLKGKRLSTAKTYLYPVWWRKNLKVLTNAYVTKIITNRNKNKAEGVLFTYNGVLYKAYARSEVILSAGVIGSPQILMLSGIGPKSHLESLNIPVIQDLPVGNHFQEHPGYHALYFSSNYTEPTRSMETYINEFLNGTGPYTIDANLQGVGFYKIRDRRDDEKSGNPDFEILIQPSNNTGDIVKRVHHYGDVAFDTIWKNIDTKSAFTLLCVVLHPVSEGTVRLKSNDPYEYPLIDTQIFSDSEGRDIAVMYEAIQKALHLVKTEPFRKLNAKLYDLPLPVCKNNYTYLSKDYWYCQLRQLTFHLFHGIGTCRMGQDPATSVVDNELKVHGISKLRVVDASVFPSMIAGHTNAPVIMVAEKAADLIKFKK